MQDWKMTDKIVGVENVLAYIYTVSGKKVAPYNFCQ